MKKLAYLGLALFFAQHVTPGDNPHFYRATNFYGEPRMERPGLASWDFTAGFGSTNQSRNSNGQKTCLLNLYGLHNMQVLGDGVPCKNVTDPLDLALINLARLPARDNFAHLMFQGNFSIAELYIFLTQNFCNGFFMEFSLPIRHLEINNIQFKDCSPTDTICPNINTMEWQTFLNLFPQILEKYGVSLGSINNKGIGDAAALFGWTKNYQETEELDYVDLTLQAGILFPTGAVRNEDLAFDIPLGYNGHLGFPISLDASFGCYQWLTLGMHLGAIVFKNNVQCLHMKTNSAQNGFIKLAKGPAWVGKGTNFEAGVYAKADHLCRGISAIIGYSYASETGDSITPRSTEIFSPAIAGCSDPIFAGWNMSTLNFILEYDFTKENCLFGPRLGLFYNLEVGGKRVFNTSVGGATFGLDVAMNF